MIINQKVEIRQELIDFKGIQRSARSSISKSERIKRNNEFKNQFEKELKKSISRKKKTIERHDHNQIQTNMAIKTNKPPKQREALKENRSVPKDRIDEKITSEVKSDKGEKIDSDKITENKSLSAPEKQNTIVSEESQKKEAMKVIFNIGKENVSEKIQNKPTQPIKIQGEHLNAESQIKESQTIKINGEQKTNDSDQNILSMVGKNLKKGLETDKPSIVEEKGKGKAENSERMIDKNTIELKMETKVDNDSSAKIKIPLVKIGAEKSNSNRAENNSPVESNHPVDNEVKNKEKSPNSNKIVNMVLHEESTEAKKIQTPPNGNTAEVKTNTLEFMANGRTNKIDPEVIHVSKTESQPAKLLPEQSIDKIMKNFIYTVKNRQSEIKIDLRPELLGDMRVEIITKNNKLNINITTDSNNIKEFIENSLGQLRSEFNNNKISVENIEVGVNNDLLKENDKQKTYDDRQNLSQNADSHDNEKHVVEDEMVDEIIHPSEHKNGMIDYYV